LLCVIQALFEEFNYLRAHLGLLLLLIVLVCIIVLSVWIALLLYINFEIAEDEYLAHEFVLIVLVLCRTALDELGKVLFQVLANCGIDF